jgi:hypothetical protein
VSCIGCGPQYQASSIDAFLRVHEVLQRLVDAIVERRRLVFGEHRLPLRRLARVAASTEPAASLHFS